jgi:cobalt-zinc-cadmium efflux system outer membrane protein
MRRGAAVLVPVLVAACTTPVLAQAAQATEPLTLDRVVARFLERNLAVEAARHRVDVARAERVAARLRPNPTFTVSGENLRLSGPTPAGELYEVTTSLAHPIELGDKRRLRLEVAAATLALAEAQLADALRQRLGEVKRAFYETLLARAGLGQAIENRRGFEELVRVSEARFREGDIAEGELLKVRLERVKFDAAVAQAELGVRHAGIRLLDLLGERDFSLAGAVAGDLATGASPPALPPLRETALRERPALRAAGQAVAVAERRVALERARATVDVEPFVGLRRAGENNTVLFGIAVPLPIYDRNQAGIARAMAEQRVAETELELQKTRVLAEVEAAWSAWATARAQATTFEAALLRQAEEARSIALTAYQEGAIGLVEYLEAQRTFTDIRQQYARSLFDAHAARLALEQATGQDLAP